MRKMATFVSAVALGAVLAAPAFARPSSPTVAVEPAVPTVGSSLVFSGCGYAPGVDVGVLVTGPTAGTYIGVTPGIDGCFSTESVTTFPIWGTGTYEVETFQSNAHKAAASLTFTVTQ